MRDLLVLLALLSAAPTFATSKRECKAVCVPAVESCTGAHLALVHTDGLRPRKLKRLTKAYRKQCQKQLVRACRGNVAACLPPVTSTTTTTTTTTRTTFVTTTTRRYCGPYGCPEPTTTTTTTLPPSLEIRIVAQAVYDLGNCGDGTAAWLVELVGYHLPPNVPVAYDATAWKYVVGGGCPGALVTPTTALRDAFFDFVFPLITTDPGAARLCTDQTLMVPQDGRVQCSLFTHWRDSGAGTVHFALVHRDSLRDGCEVPLPIVPPLVLPLSTGPQGCY